MMKKNLLFSIICSLLILMQPVMAQEIVSQDIFKYAREGNVAEIRRLIAANVDVNQQEGRDGNTALMFAIKHGRTAVVRELLNAPGIDLNIRNYENQTTALIDAAFGGHAEVVWMLVKAGADVHKQDGNGFTALGWAAVGRHDEIIKELVKAGADYEPYITIPIVQQVLRELRQLGTPQRLLEREIGGRKRRRLK